MRNILKQQTIMTLLRLQMHWEICLYILCGTIIEHGLQYKIEEVFEEIQRSNMSKLDENGEPIYREDGKVLKGPNYFKPDIKTILDK